LKLDAFTRIMVEDRGCIEAAAQKFCDELEAAARVVDPSASVCDAIAHVEIHTGQDHSSRGESISIDLGPDPGVEPPLSELGVQQCVLEELHCLKCFPDGRCKICGFLPNAGAAFGCGESP
jgi:hypothetical protein